MRQAIYMIEIDGSDVSSDIDPILISLQIKLGDGEEADSVEMELDDTEGQIELPEVGASVSVTLYWSDGGQGIEFQGTTDEVRSNSSQHNHRGGGRGDSLERMNSSGSRSKGRTLTLSASSANFNGKLKSPKSAHMDKSTFGDVAQAWAGKAGVSVSVDGSLSSISRDYWGMANESFMHWGTRIAREIGATFKIIGSQAVFAPRSGGTATSGASLQSVNATWGDNLIEWSIAPVLSRPVHKSFSARYYDVVAASHKTGKADGGDDAIDEEGDDDADHIEKFKSPDENHAKARSGSNQAESKRDRGGADSVTIDGEPAAQAEATCNVSGIRPGVDGTYTISDVTHTLSRGSGFTTRLSLKQPTGGAGTDSRSSTGNTSPVPLTPAESAQPTSTTGSGGIGHQ